MGRAGAQRLPPRPQTVGELLDAATNLPRRNALPLICAGFVLALAERGALYPPRRAAGVTPPRYLPTKYGRLSTCWVLLAAGFGTETVIIVLLGGLAARASVAGLARAIVNAIAYPALACLDAVVHLENRMRVEGLDITLSRALRRERPTEAALAVPG